VRSNSCLQIVCVLGDKPLQPQHLKVLGTRSFTFSAKVRSRTGCMGIHTNCDCNLGAEWFTIDFLIGQIVTVLKLLDFPFRFLRYRARSGATEVKIQTRQSSATPRDVS
jgi:hypothetical protein